MVKTIEAMFDGQVLVPTEPLRLEPNTQVRITIETIAPEHKKRKKKKGTFFDTAMSLNLEGPADWSTNLEHYLYG
jgi:hypothetical protein